jgi:hypothetical protein
VIAAIVGDRVGYAVAPFLAGVSRLRYWRFRPNSATARFRSGTVDR